MSRGGFTSSTKASTDMTPTMSQQNACVEVVRLCLPHCAVQIPLVRQSNMGSMLSLQSAPIERICPL